MLAAATPRTKRHNSIVTKAAQKINNEQVENNANAIELLEQSLMQTVEQLQEQNEQLEQSLKQIQAQHKTENNMLMMRNTELTNQLETVKKSQVLMLEKIDKLVTESANRQLKCDADLSANIQRADDKLVDDYRNMEAIVTENQLKITRQEETSKINVQQLSDRISVLEQPNELTTLLSDDVKNISEKCSAMQSSIIDNATNILNMKQSLTADQSSCHPAEKTLSLNLEMQCFDQKIAALDTRVTDITTNIYDIQQKMLIMDTDDHDLHNDEGVTNAELVKINEKLSIMEGNITGNTVSLGEVTQKLRAVETQSTQAASSGRWEEQTENIIPGVKPDENKNEPISNKKSVSADVILVMDSNRQHIVADQFWHNHTCEKIVAGNVYQATQVTEKTKFSNVKHAILHIGTNDIETRKPADLIANEIVQVASKLQKNSNATTYISILPPRADNLNGKRQQVNEHLRKCVPESITLIDNDVNLSVTDLVDKKHLKESSVRKLVGNMKNAIRSARKTFREDERRDDRYDAAQGERRREHKERRPSYEKPRNKETWERRGGGDFFNNGYPNQQRNQTVTSQNKLDSILNVLKNFVSTVTPIIS